MIVVNGKEEWKVVDRLIVRDRCWIPLSCDAFRWRISVTRPVGALKVELCIDDRSCMVCLEEVEHKLLEADVRLSRTDTAKFGYAIP